jgi:hypothetical protein
VSGPHLSEGGTRVTLLRAGVAGVPPSGLRRTRCSWPVGSAEGASTSNGDRGWVVPPLEPRYWISRTRTVRGRIVPAITLLDHELQPVATQRSWRWTRSRFCNPIPPCGASVRLLSNVRNRSRIALPVSLTFFVEVPSVEARRTCCPTTTLTCAAGRFTCSWTARTPLKTRFREVRAAGSIGARTPLWRVDCSGLRRRNAGTCAGRTRNARRGRRRSGMNLVVKKPGDDRFGILSAYYVTFVGCADWSVRVSKEEEQQCAH